MLLALLIKFLLISLSIALAGGNVFCSEQYCQTYRQKNQCPVLSTGCQIQNETHNGEIFPAAEPCNCCDVCLENLKEGDYCTKGSIDTPPPSFACGPGLYCDEDDSGQYKCKKMTNTPCFKEQNDFDKKQLANLTGSFMQRPKCDGDGNYLEIKCSPGQMCFCVDENGKRIFGESQHSIITELTMKCECSRLNDKLGKLIQSRYPVVTTRCLEDGSFDPLQCMGDMCMCVDRNTGFSATDTYNVTEIGYKNLPCYNKTVHRSWIYLHNCELIQHEYIEEIQISENAGYTVINFQTPLCQPDGWYWPVQENSTHKYCVDKYGRQLEEYAILKVPDDGMNCLCARTRDILRRNVELDKPECCTNGNFKRVQCRSGKCYCVDLNGLQITKEENESNVTSLTCYNHGDYCS